MKVRKGFVSNSSSSSFVISLSDISTKQMMMIIDHQAVAKSIGGFDSDDQWDIEMGSDYIRGFTFMDNFDMRTFLTQYVDVPEDAITWGDY